jgi:hypothetical protein
MSFPFMVVSGVIPASRHVVDDITSDIRAVADYATYPPSIVTLEPVMKPASGLAK